MSPGEGIALRISEDARADLEVRLAPVNVLGVADLERLATLIGHAREARVLVLTGLPRAFSAGVSVSDHEPESAAIERMLAAMRLALTALVETPAITLAAVSGACLGGGAEIAAACDLVLAAEDARIGFPEIRLACFPPGATALLPLRIGQARANDWILTGRTLSGREAAEAGFASRAVEAAALSRETERLVAELLSRSPKALSAARDLLRFGRREALAAALPRAEAAYRSLVGDAALSRAVREFPRR
ncbi:MAG: enoyl-CoA hydratase/isomerase family protein [Thermoanaerobaculia bacterium]